MRKCLYVGPHSAFTLWRWTGKAKDSEKHIRNRRLNKWLDLILHMHSTMLPFYIAILISCILYMLVIRTPLYLVLRSPVRYFT